MISPALIGTFVTHFFRNVPRINRILGFLAVGIVLVFNAKISKASLYTTFFKSLEDFEVRNSTAVEDYGLLLENGLEKANKASTIEAEGGAAGSFQLDENSAQWELPQAETLRYDYIPTFSERFLCFYERAPRAPGA